VTKKRIPCEVYSRIVGYLRPVGWWAKHKQLEFEQRRTYINGTRERPVR
jgi:anaerobic ribonucleoside-triphosphate reductase